MIAIISLIIFANRAIFQASLFCFSIDFPQIPLQSTFLYLSGIPFDVLPKYHFKWLLLSDSVCSSKYVCIHKQFPHHHRRYHHPCHDSNIWFCLWKVEDSVYIYKAHIPWMETRCHIYIYGDDITSNRQ